MEAPNDAMLERLRENNVVQLVPQGVSMLPFIHGGVDEVLLKRKDKVVVGDIVLVKYRGNLLLHRVYAIDGSRLTLMGDGNLKGTEQVASSDVWATVIAIVKPGGRCRKPGKAWLWRHALVFRRVLLKMGRKWNKWFGKQQKKNTI